MFRLKGLLVLIALWSSATVHAQQSPLFEKPIEKIHLDELRRATWAPIDEWWNLYEAVRLPLKHLTETEKSKRLLSITCQQILDKEEGLYLNSQRIHQFYRAKIKSRDVDLLEDIHATYGDLFFNFAETMHSSIRYFCSLTSANESTLQYYEQLGKSMDHLTTALEFLDTEILQPEE